MSSQMNDPKADDRLTEDQRFQDSETSTIDPLHAIMRCICEGGGNPMSQATILKTFSDAGNPRTFEGTVFADSIERGIREGYLETIAGVGWRVTENGRSAIGPMLEMELKFV